MLLSKECGWTWEYTKSKTRMQILLAVDRLGQLRRMEAGPAEGEDATPPGSQGVGRVEKVIAKDAKDIFAALPL